MMDYHTTDSCRKRRGGELVRIAGREGGISPDSSAHSAEITKRRCRTMQILAGASGLLGDAGGGEQVAHDPLNPERARQGADQGIPHGDQTAQYRTRAAGAISMAVVVRFDRMQRPRRLSQKDARQAAEQAAQYLAGDPRVRLVYLFGSAIDQQRAAVRDVDVAVLTDPPLSPDDLLQLRADLVLATGTAIDLVSLNDASVVLAWEVADSGRCLHAADADTEVEFVTRARDRYWDFKPFLDEQWRLAGERLRERQRGPST